MFMTGLRIMAAAAVVALGAPAVQAQAADLFAAAEEPPLSGPLADTTLRHRVVSIDFGQLQRVRAKGVSGPSADRAVARTGEVERKAAAATLTLNLFDDIVVTGRVERTEPAFSGGYSVAGRIVGDPCGFFVLVVNGETVAGTVRRAGETYRIRSADGGLFAISEVEEPPLQCETETVRLD